MIRAARLCWHHRLKVRGPSSIVFAGGVNVLVGPNGSGKSTVLRALVSCQSCRKEVSRNATVRYFDAETMNPHIRAGPPGTMANMALKTRAVFSSHGQILRAALAALPIRTGDVLLIDEPEAAQDLGGVEEIRKAFAAVCAKGGQVIAASHHPIIWQDANVIELVPGHETEVRQGLCRALCASRDEPTPA